MPQGPYFYFDRDKLRSIAADFRAEYVTAEPFPHVVIDDFLPTDVLDAVLQEFPEGGTEWTRYENDRERKLELSREEAMPPFIRHLLSQFNSSTCLEFLEELTDIPGLVPDPHLWGGGLHQIEPGGLLKVHADFNWHSRLLLDRRINLLLYLNPDWREEYGGHLELWTRDMSTCAKRILPILNRCVVFSTTDWSMHGHPDPLQCPPGRTRRSLALYYYSNGRPTHELSDSHSTLFEPRPGEAWRRPVDDPQASPWVGRAGPRWVPPLVQDWRRSGKMLADLVLPVAITESIRKWRRRR